MLVRHLILDVLFRALESYQPVCLVRGLCGNLWADGWLARACICLVVLQNLRKKKKIADSFLFATAMVK